MQVSTAAEAAAGEMSGNTVTVSTQSHNNHDNNYNSEESKRKFASKLTRSSRWLCLPKQRATSSRAFACFKMFLCIFFIAMFFFEIALNILCIKYYRDRVQDLRDSEIWPPRTRIQVESTNGHFFLFTTLMVGTAILIGILAIFMENLIMLAGYAYVHGIVTGFEIIGAWQSYDQQVVIRKIIGVAPEPIMVILALVFANMCRNNERALAKSPMFKQLMAAKAGKGETMSDPNHRLAGEDENDDDKNNNDKKTKQPTVAIEMEKGHVNNAFDSTDEVDPRQGVTSSSSSASSYSSLSNEKKLLQEQVTSSSAVTVLVDGKTRISVTGHESSGGSMQQVDDLADPVNHGDSPEGDGAPCDEDHSNEQTASPAAAATAEEGKQVEGQKDEKNEGDNETRGEEKEEAKATDESERHSSISSSEQDTSDWCPSSSMSSRMKGASVVGYEEKASASKNESNQMKRECKSNESRIL